MTQNTLAGLVLALALFAPRADAQVLEDFEHGNIGLYTNVGVVQNMSFTPASAHDGLLGAEFSSSVGAPDWFYRTDLITRPDHSYRAYVRATTNLSGFLSFAVAAGSGGGWTAALDFSGGSIQLHDDTGWGAKGLAKAAFSPQLDTWYQLELEWAADGAMVVRAYDESGGQVLAETTSVATGVTTIGGLGVKGVPFPGTFHHMDTVREVSIGSGRIYCTAKTNSLGCVPAISRSGLPSASSTSGFTVACAQVRNQKPGLLFYKAGGAQANLTYQCGTLCLGPANIRRTPARSSGGNPPPANDCSGVFGIDMNAFAAGAAGGNPDPQLLVAGTVVHAQWWGRDQGFLPPCNTTLSDAVEYTINP